MPKVVVVGSVNVDIVIELEHLPSPGETVMGSKFSIRQGGKGANQAVSAARLGASTFLVGAIGDDWFGGLASEALLREGVDITHLAVTAETTGVAQILVDRRGENMVAVASGANALVGAEEVKAALPSILTPGAVVVTNLEIRDDAVLAAARLAHEHSCKFILNPAPARRLSPGLLRFCDVLTPNEHEVGALGQAAVEDLLKAGVGAIIVTRGPEGADLFVDGQPLRHQRAFPVHVVDTTGAGDAFSGTLAWALACGRALQDALRLASAGGALAVRKLGAREGMATAAEVQALAGMSGS